MSRMKTFIKYLILFLLFYMFVSFMSYGFIRSTLKPMEDNIIDVDNPTVTIQDAESSRVNGYVKGIIKNTTGADTRNKYIRFDFISDKENVILSKYVDISDLNNNGEKNFDVKFNAENITKYRISLSDTGNQEEISTNRQELWEVLGALFLGWMIFPR